MRVCSIWDMEYNCCIHNIMRVHSIWDMEYNCCIHNIMRVCSIWDMEYIIEYPSIGQSQLTNEIQ